MNAAILGLMFIINEAAKESKRAGTDEEAFYSPSVEKWIFEEPLRTKYAESDFGSTMNYISENLSNQNGRCGMISIDGYPDFYKPRIWDIMDCHSSDWQSKAFKEPIKFWKKQHFMDAILRRLMRVEYTLRIHEKIHKDPKALYRFMRMDMTDEHWSDNILFDNWEDSFRNALHMKYKKQTEFFPWQAEFIPYIRKNLVECMELMGVSFYDWIYDGMSALRGFRYYGDYSLQLIPMIGLSRMYKAVVTSYENAIHTLRPTKLTIIPDKEYVNQELEKFAYDPHDPDVREWCLTRPLNMHRDTWNMLRNINTFHPLMTIDYMWACVNEIGYVCEHRNEQYPFVTNLNKEFRPEMLRMLNEELQDCLKLLKDFQYLEQYTANQYGNTWTWEWNLFFVDTKFDARHVIAGQYYKQVPEHKRHLVNYDEDRNYFMFEDLEHQMKKVGRMIRNNTGGLVEEDY
mgnify:FL=1